MTIANGKLLSSRLANVAGTQEPIYGPSAIKAVAQEAKETNTPYSELTRADHTWLALDKTCVENQVFYFFAENGTIAMAQVIYSNVAYDASRCHDIDIILADFSPVEAA
jgi:hypothetical protein